MRGSEHKRNNAVYSKGRSHYVVGIKNNQASGLKSVLPLTKGVTTSKLLTIVASYRAVVLHFTAHERFLEFCLGMPGWHSG